MEKVAPAVCGNNEIGCEVCIECVECIEYMEWIELGTPAPLSQISTWESMCLEL
jgi:hypothetical protein